MKLKNALSSVLVVGCSLGVASLFAATCNNTQGNLIQFGVQPGNSCTHNPNYNGSTFCGGVSFSSTGTDVWQVNLGAAQNFTFSVTSAVFTPDIALLQTTCADNANCINEASSGTGTATSGTISGIPAGTYFIIVTDSTSLGAQCGAYNLTLSGPLPVKLQDFSVQ